MMPYVCLDAGLCLLTRKGGSGAARRLRHRVVLRDVVASAEGVPGALTVVLETARHKVTVRSMRLSGVHWLKKRSGMALGVVASVADVR